MIHGDLLGKLADASAGSVRTDQGIVSINNLLVCDNLHTYENIPHHIATLLTTAWVGGLWATGYLAAPVLFSAQPDKQLAGMLAGQMFALINMIGIACGAYLLWHRFSMFERSPARKQIVWIIASMLLITLVLQYGIQPMMAQLKAQALPLDVMQSALAEKFKALHGISQLFYLIQSLLGAALVIKSK